MQYPISKKRKLVTLKRFKNWLLSLVGLSIIILAITFTLIRVSIKAIPDYKESIQQEVSQQLGIQLAVGSLDAEIYWLVPRLILYDVNVFDAEGKKQIIQIHEVDLSLDWLAMLKTGIPAVNEVVIDGINIQIGVNKKSQLVLQDFVLNENLDEAMKAAGSAADQAQIPVSEELKYLLNNLNFKVVNSNVRLFHEKYPEYNKTLGNFNLKLFNSGLEHRFEVKATLPERYGESAHIIVDLDGDLFDYKNLSGQVYASTTNIKVAPWINDYWKGAALAINANVNTEFWLEWDAGVIQRASSRFSFRDVAFHYLDESVKTRELEQLNGQLSWQRERDGWVVDARNIESLRKGKPLLASSAATLRKSDLDNELHLQADHLRIEGLAYLAGMLFSMDETRVNWLDLLVRHKPEGDLKNLDIILPLAEPENIKINTEFSGIGFAMPDMEPAEVKNISGSIIYYGNETWLALDSNNVSLNFNSLFREQLDLSQLKGVVSLAYSQDEITIGTGSLTIGSDHITTESRLELKIYPDDVFMDLTTRILGGDAAYTGRYLPVGVMGEGTVSWLDRAIVKGRLVGGGYQFYGHFSEAPFNHYEGISVAQAKLEDAKLDYMDGWPALTEMKIDLDFLNDSMVAKIAKARVLNTSIKQSEVQIGAFSSPILDIKLAAETDLNDVHHYLLNSGLKDNMPDYLNNLQLTGAADLSLELFIPLDDTSNTEWGGHLTTQDGAITFKKEKYRLDQIIGELRFADKYFEIKDMQGQLDGQMLSIDLHTRKQGGVFNYIIKANGELEMRSLLSPLPEYQKYVDGRSPWDFTMNIYSGFAEPGLRLDLKAKSDLKGTASVLYGPLAKSSKTGIPARFNMQLFSNSNVKYDLTLSEKDRLSLHEFSQSWVLTVDSESIKGVVDVKKNNTDQAMKFDLDHLNVDQFLKPATDEIQLVKKEVFPRNIPSLNVVARNVSWKNFRFNQLNLLSRQANSGMEIDKLKLEADDYNVNASGHWRSRWNDNHTTALDADIRIHDLGKMLSKLKVSKGLESAEGWAKSKVNWQGTPFEFDWKRLRGSTSVSVKDGVIKDIEVGAGRMLGIFSFQTLFSLDFASQMTDGFAFDRAKGAFNFVNGKAITDDFVIESKVADMAIKGHVNIVRSTVEQNIRIKPHIGSTISLGSAVVAGPAVGGLVYLFHKIFDPDKLSEYEYSVKGKIDDPVVELLSSPIEDPVPEDDFDTDA